MIIILTIGCQKADDFLHIIPTPEHFPAIDYPIKNKPQLEKIALGKSLFFDTRLSVDSTLSCASCHLPEYAFSDTLAVSKGVHGAVGKRNAPSLMNVAYVPLFNKDGGVTKLEIFSLLPIEDHSEMGIPAIQLVDRLSGDAHLQQTAQQLYGRPLDAFVITRSLAQFSRSLISAESHYDDFLKEGLALNDSEERGRELFFSPKTNCSKCHNGVLLTNHQFESNGTKVEYLDQGRKLISAKETDRGKFRVPSLRNVAITGPYMHDGSFDSLAEIIEHYNKGGQKHINQSEFIKPLGLSNEDKNDLIAFLHSLTDKKYIYN